MLYDLYTAVKNRLSTADTGSQLKGVEWYNVQYEGSIANTPRVFIEFPDRLSIDQLSKQARRTAVKIRLHVVTQAIASTDGAVPDTQAQAHEAVAQWVADTLDRFTPLSGETPLSTPLQLTGWQHWHKHKGWMVTFVELEARVLL